MKTVGRWNDEDIEFLREYYPSEGPKLCAEVLDRTIRAIEAKAGRLGIKSGRFWSIEDVEFIKENYLIEGAQLCAEVLNKNVTSVYTKAGRLGIVSKPWSIEEEDFLTKYYPIKGVSYCADALMRSKSAIKGKALRLNLELIKYKAKKKTTEQYRSEIPKDYIVLEEYLGGKIPLLHKHLTCGYEWTVQPNNIISGRGCPACSTKGFNPTLPGYLYFIYFEELNLYKIGITNRSKGRFKEFGYTPKIIKQVLFETGSKAREVEQAILKKYQDYKHDSGLLKSGNTETLLLDKDLEKEVLLLIDEYSSN